MIQLRCSIEFPRDYATNEYKITLRIQHFEDAVPIHDEDAFIKSMTGFLDSVTLAIARAKDDLVPSKDLTEPKK